MTDTISQLNAALSDRYDIERELGAGGMATVYLARDIKHDRQVAVKVLRPELGAVLGVERFLAEIRVTASLQHPNLLPLFDSGDANGQLFYVMPYVQGESLRARLSREKQLDTDGAVHIAVAVAGALHYAHRQNVIHRDLKPENILLHEGEPLIADFGIALAVSKAGGARITQTGVSLGTPQYMSPEQATGDRAIDGRTDIYSLAAVTYEMLTGEPPHSGNTSQAIIAKLLTDDVRPIAMLRRSVPPHVDATVLRALQKLPADRFATAHEFAESLCGRVAVTSVDGARRAVPGTSPQRASTGLRVASVVATVATGVAIWLGVTRPAPTGAQPTAFVLNFEPNERLGTGIGLPFALSPDGRTVAYVASRAPSGTRLYVRRLEELRGREIPGTDNAWYPAFSPDGKWIAFGTPTQVRKVGLAGGAPLPVANVLYSAARGMTWGRNGLIILGDVRNALLLVSENGGDTTRFRADSAQKGELGQRWPMMLDDGEHLVYASWTGGSISSNRLWIASIPDRKARPLGVVGTMPLGMVGDRLIYVSPSGSLMAVGLDVDGMRTTGGPPTPLPEQIAVDPTPGWARASLARDGSLIYQAALAGLQLALFDIDTRSETPLLPDRRVYSFPRVSPDGRRVAVGITEASGVTDLWILDRGAGTMQRLTEGDGTNDRPEWMPDGKRVLYRSSQGQGIGIKWQVADRSATASTLHLASLGSFQLNEAVVSPDGQWLVFRVFGTEHPMDLWYRRLSGDTTTRKFIVSPAYETAPRFSPDSKWLAYSSDESGPRQVYVTPFPGPGPRHQVSTGGGQEPVWSPDGKRLFYVVREAQIMAASVTLTPTFAVTERRIVLDGSFAFNYVHANYDVSRDGKQLLVLKRDVEAQAIVVTNWGSTIRAPRR